MMIILVIILVLLAAIVITLLVVLLHHRGSEDTSTTTKIALNSIPTTKIPVTTQNSNPNSKGTTANPEKTTVTSEPAVKTPYPAPPTDPVETTAPPAPDIPRCAPSPPPNPPYLFAYSNDLSPNVVSLTADTFFDALDKDGSSYATVRFDTSPEDPVYFAPDTSSVHSIVNGRLPNPALSFKTTAIGSDIIKTIERYYTSAVQHGFSTCGAIIHIDRAPIFGVRPIYCANVQVSDLDFYQLPNFNVPRNVPRLNRVSFTVQDHGPIDSFQRLELKFSDITNATLVTKIAVEAEDVRKLGSTGYSTWLGFVAGDEYRTEIDCDYTSDDIEELQIRVQTYEPFWIPYCD
ncbi:hypothetical protein L3Y34_016409 [Caenorhabditis briggsae]|uniref:DUF7154 domain-containing protein n=1 Tax=Caenorhabditis briggsae TaxID=6238 RepID=A0AAE9DX68_CAEBR|nr:hypothetical protein L3Y34_016409 [Caenorhabditis briggsae]